MATKVKPTTLYDFLGIPNAATGKEIQSKYRSLVKQFHPDVNAAPDAAERFKEIKTAYDVLGDPVRRASYDWTLNAAAQESPSPGPDDARLRHAMRGVWFMRARPSTFFNGGTLWRSGMAAAVVTILIAWGSLSSAAGTTGGPGAGSLGNSGCSAQTLNAAENGVTDKMNADQTRQDLAAIATDAEAGYLSISALGCTHAGDVLNALTQISNAARQAGAHRGDFNPTAYNQAISGLGAGIYSYNAGIKASY